MKTSKINLNQKRDFSEVINATFTFIKQEFKSLGKVIILYAGLPILASSIAGGYYSSSQLTQAIQILQNPSLQPVQSINFLFLLLFFFLTFLAYMFISGLSASYLTLYSQKDSSEFSHNDVWQYFYTRIIPLFFLNIVNFLILLGLALISLIVIVLLATFAAFSVVVNAFIVFFAIISLFIIFYISVPLSFSYIPVIDENKGVIEAIKRAFYLIKNNWWISFGILIIVMIIVFLVGSLFALPTTLLTFFKTYLAYAGEGDGGQSVVYILLNFLGNIAQYLIFPIVYIALGIQFYNLKEKKENPELFQKISEISQE